MVDISEISDISPKSKLIAAYQEAVKEFVLHHDPRRGFHVCWEWPKYKVAKGYGVIIFDGFKFSVHRLSFEYYKGRIPKGMVVMHQCDNPPCFNPNHLFLGTHTENMRDMARKGRAANGHTYKQSQNRTWDGALLATPPKDDLRELMEERENKNRWWNA